MIQLTHILNFIEHVSTRLLSSSRALFDIEYQKKEIIVKTLSAHFTSQLQSTLNFYDEISREIEKKLVSQLEVVDFEIIDQLSHETFSYFRAYFAALNSDLTTLRDWMIDSEYTNHMFFDKNEFIEYRPYREEVIVVNEVTVWTQERDTVEMKWLLKNEISNIVRVENVLHVSDFICELFLISQVIKKRFEIVFLGDNCHILKNDVLVESASKTRNIYILNVSQSTIKIVVLIQKNTRALFIALMFNEDAVELWHRRIRHLNEIDLKRLVNMSKDITLT